MSWHTQLRTLEVAGDALPTWGDAPLFVASRLRGKEKLGRLYDYEGSTSRPSRRAACMSARCTRWST